MWLCLLSGRSLRRHLKTHSGEKSNKCNQCNFACSVQMVTANWVQFIPFFWTQSVFSYGSSNRLPEKKHSHIGCICLIFLHCVFSNASSNRLPEKMQSRIGCIHMTYISVRFQIWRSKVALVAFVWLFSTVCFQMSPQIACLGRSKVTLVAWGNKL